jgi:hypothetical protein
MKRSLAWLWLSGALLYAVSAWLPPDAVNVAEHKGPNPVASSPTIATQIRIPPVTEPSKTEPQSLPNLDLPSPSATSQQSPSQQAEASSGAATTAPVERLMVRSAANIRRGPTSKSTVIGTAPAGAELEVAERTGRWVRFVDPATHNTGWIFEGVLAGIGAESVTSAVEQSNAASVGTAGGSKASVQARNATHRANTAAKPKAKAQADNATGPASGGQGARNRPFTLGYANTPPAEEFGENKRRLGFFARRRMIKQRSLGE